MYCGQVCNQANKHSNEAVKRKAAKEIRTAQRNKEFADLNRDRYINKIDARTAGPLNTSDTTIEKLVKDKRVSVVPLSRDIPTPKVGSKFVQYDPLEYEQFDKKQKSFTHSLSMPRNNKCFCTQCAERVVDKKGNEVRVTRGVYLPIEHDCPRVRVYDLQGKLIEVI